MYVLEIPCFSLDQMYRSNQVNRWIKVNDKKYIIPFEGNILKIEQQKDRVIFDCTEDEALGIWYDYFDLGKDYLDSYYALKAIDDDTKIVANRAKGVRILKQGLFETILSCLLHDLDYKAELIDEIARRTGVKHGKSMKEMGIVEWYEFPTPQMLLKKWSFLRDCNFSGREEKVRNVVELIAEGWFDFDELVFGGKEYILEFDEFDETTASLVCLYGLHDLREFPLDDIGLKILDKYGLTYDEFYAWFVEGNERIENNLGLLRQYMIYNDINEIPRVEPWMRE